jgi:hypothetical protein
MPVLYKQKNPDRMLPAGVLISVMFASDAHPGPCTHTTTTMAIGEEICTVRFNMLKDVLTKR